MADKIDRQQLLDDWQRIMCGSNVSHETRMHLMKIAIEKAKAHTGCWHSNDQQVWSCGECGFEVQRDVPPDYCEECGAHMTNRMWEVERG